MPEIIITNSKKVNNKKDISSWDKWMELYQILCYYTDLPAVNLAFCTDNIKAGRKNLYEKVKYFNDWLHTSLIHSFGT